MSDYENRSISPDQEDDPEAKSPAELLARIVATPETCFGKPRVDGTRFYVAAVLEYFAAGMTEDEILADFPYVTRSDLRACLLYAANITAVKPTGMKRRVDEVWEEAMKEKPVDPLRPRGGLSGVKFLLDEESGPAVGRQADGSGGHEAIHVLDTAGGASSGDPDIAKAADAEGRAVISRDKDFPESHRKRGRSRRAAVPDDAESETPAADRAVRAEPPRDSRPFGRATASPNSASTGWFPPARQAERPPILPLTGEDGDADADGAPPSGASLSR